MKLEFDWDYFFGGIGHIGAGMITAANVAAFLKQEASVELLFWGVLFFVLGCIGKSIEKVKST